MKFNQYHPSPNGFATILTLLGMLLVAVSLPIATKLVSQNQDNRSSARMVIDDDGGKTSSNPKTNTPVPSKPKVNTPAPVNPGGHEPECDKDQTKCIDGFINTCNSSYRWTKTSQTCTDPKVTAGIPLCTKVTYSSWSDCINGKQTRTVTKEPSNCSGGVTVEASEQTCTIAPTCTSFTPGEWGVCNQFADGYFQTRTVTGNPSGCTGGTPPNTRQACTNNDGSNGGHEPECDKDDTKCIDGFINTCNSSFRWVKTSKTCSDPKVTQGVPLCTKVTYGSWSDCIYDDIFGYNQTRTVTKQPSNCSGGVTVLPNKQECFPVCTSYEIGEWGECSENIDGYFKTRPIHGRPYTCKGGNPPPDRQSCIPCDSNHCSTCGSPNNCRLAGCYWNPQVRTCTSESNICTSTNCDACGYSDCSAVGCYWNPEITTCSTKPKTYTSNCGYKNYIDCIGGGCKWRGSYCAVPTSISPSEMIPTLDDLYKEYGVDPSLGLEALQEAIRLRSYSEVQSVVDDNSLKLIEALTGVRISGMDDDTLFDYCTTESCRIAKEYNLPDLTTESDKYSFASDLIEQNKGVNYIVGEQVVLDYDPLAAYFYKTHNYAGGFVFSLPGYRNKVFAVEEDLGVIAHELVHINQLADGNDIKMTNTEMEYEAYVYSTMVNYLDNAAYGLLSDNLVEGISGSTNKTVEELLTEQLVEQLVDQLMKTSGY